MWPEVVIAAVWLLNRTPTYLQPENKWIIPWEEVRKDFSSRGVPKINLSNVKLYGSLAYCRIQKQVQSQKLVPRAEIGFLVSYIASNVWRIWFPHSGKIRVVRDAIFDETRKYDAGYQHYQQVPMPIAAEPEILTDFEVLELLTQISSAEAQRQHTESLESRPHIDNNDKEAHPNLPREVDSGHCEGVANTEKVINTEKRIVTPSPTPERRQSEPEVVQEAPIRRLPDQEQSVSNSQNSPRTPRGLPGLFPDERFPPLPRSPTLPLTPPAEGVQPDQGVVHMEEPDLPAFHENFEEVEDPSVLASTDDELEQQLQWEMRNQTLTQEITSQIDTSTNIITDARTRRQRADHHEYASHMVMETQDPPVFLAAFAQGLHAEKPELRRHRDDLPAEPRNWKEAMKHQFAQAWSDAMKKETDSLLSKQVYTVTDRPADRSKQILPLTWVYTYKFDQDGYLIKFKARICVRGDLETITHEDKRAVTLAAKTARMIFALIAAYDLDVRQRDAVTAFLNATLEKETYTQMPEGFSIPGKCWRLHRALYGLRVSPRLWQQEAARVLKKLGLEQIPEDPCVFIGKGIIIFFYVDDILIACHSSARERARLLERQLEEYWELTDHGEAEWFLNIRIIRDRMEKKLWLCQDSYITGMAARYNLTGRAPMKTPMTTEELLPYEGIADPQAIRTYQMKVGSAGYATTITRVDAAKATAKLA